MTEFSAWLGDVPAAWDLPDYNEVRILRLVERMKRVPAIRLSYRRIKNGHARPVARKPAHRGRRHAW